jgi:hypothetical protein
MAAKQGCLHYRQLVVVSLQATIDTHYMNVQGGIPMLTPSTTAGVNSKVADMCLVPITWAHIGIYPSLGTICMCHCRTSAPRI